MIRAVSHLVVATTDVPAISRFFSDVFGAAAAFENDQFVEFVLPSRFRVAFFLPVGLVSKHFDTAAPRAAMSIGVTVEDVDAVFRRVEALGARGHSVSGPPKDHPWGERSFLLVDPDGNRWEVTQSPSADGTLVDR